MKRAEIEDRLRRWGRAFGDERKSLEAERESSDFGDSPMARFCVQPIRQVTTMDRAGLARRRLHGDAAGTGRAVPTWAVAHVSCQETRSGRPSAPTTYEWEIPPDLRDVERLWLQLNAVDEELAKALRSRYCEEGDQKDKARALSLTVGVYRERVAEAKGWMLRAISA